MTKKTLEVVIASVEKQIENAKARVQSAEAQVEQLGAQLEAKKRELKTLETTLIHYEREKAKAVSEFLAEEHGIKLQVPVSGARPRGATRSAAAAAPATPRGEELAKQTEAILNLIEEPMSIGDLETRLPFDPRSAVAKLKRDGLLVSEGRGRGARLVKAE